MQAKVGDLCLPIVGMPKYELDGDYLECLEKSPGAGEWVRRTCPIGTSFDGSTQQCTQKHNPWRNGVDSASPYDRVHRQSPYCPSTN